jgi:hypothetical protein
MDEAELAAGERKTVIPRGQQGAALTIVIIMLGVFILMNTPLCPMLSVTVVIDIQPSTPTLSVTAFSYDKIPLPITLVTTRDVPYIVGGPSVGGEASLKVSVAYKGVLLSEKTFVTIGNGAYQIKVIYLPRSEEKGTPYMVTLTLSYKNKDVKTSVNINP